jgi:hypothetical protein
MSDPRPPRYLKSMNKLMMAVQKLGIPTGPAMVLTVPGRKSGKPRSTPMTPFRYDEAAGTGTLSRGRRSRAVRIVELTAAQARPILRIYPGEVPVGVSFAKSSGMVVDGTPDEFEALAGRIAVFRFDPIAPG